MSILGQFYVSSMAALGQFYGSVRSVLCQFYVRGYAPGVAPVWGACQRHGVGGFLVQFTISCQLTHVLVI